MDDTWLQLVSQWLIFDRRRLSTLTLTDTHWQHTRTRANAHGDKDLPRASFDHLLTVEVKYWSFASMGDFEEGIDKVLPVHPRQPSAAICLYLPVLSSVKQSPTLRIGLNSLSFGDHAFVISNFSMKTNLSDRGITVGSLDENERTTTYVNEEELHCIKPRGIMENNSTRSLESGFRSSWWRRQQQQQQQRRQ